jgi:menaquinone-dependent protoporphyrinogen IX oxidase
LENSLRFASYQIKADLGSNEVIYAELKVPTIIEEITKFIVKYRDKITTHPKELACTLLEEDENGRQKVQTNRFNNQMFINKISQICEHMFGEYS